MQVHRSKSPRAAVYARTRKASGKAGGMGPTAAALQSTTQRPINSIELLLVQSTDVQHAYLELTL